MACVLHTCVTFIIPVLTMWLKRETLQLKKIMYTRYNVYTKTAHYV